MAYCNNGKMWCLPSDLTTSELQDMVELLWEDFTFYHGDDLVFKMMKQCEYEIHQRDVLRCTRNLCNWSQIGWPKDKTPVIEYDFNAHTATVVIFKSSLELQRWKGKRSSVPPRKTSKSSGTLGRAPAGSTGTNTKTTAG